MAISKIKTGSITDSAITSDKISDGSIVNADISPSAAIDSGKLTVDTSALEADIKKNAFNVSLLGFKMAVNEGLTVFNLADGVVDEFNDETGTDEAEGSNDTYNCSSDFYLNSTSPTGSPFCAAISAGFAIASITEPDTSTSNTNPAQGVGTTGSFTVPSGMTSANIYAWGAGGGSEPSGTTTSTGGGGGFASGTLAVTGSQVLQVMVGEGGDRAAGGNTYGGLHPNSPSPTALVGSRRGGGGMAYVGTGSIGSAPDVVLIGAGGGANGNSNNNPTCSGAGGGGGGLTGGDGGPNTPALGGEGGSQSAGGAGGAGPGGVAGCAGGFLYGGWGHRGGGVGYYGGGGGGDVPGSRNAGSGGGSSYYGHPQVTSGSTEAGNEGASPIPARGEGGGTASPFYVPGTNDAGDTGSGNAGDDGYVLITGTKSVSASATSTTIVSDTFTSSSVATSSRIVVFEEDIDSPTLNTDIIASVSRDGGSNFTSATLSDSGYVTGSSGQRILTGQADISGQPSGQSMRWKLQLANNQVKIHGVSLQWS